MLAPKIQNKDKLLKIWITEKNKTSAKFGVGY
jgi:hypothetical protein